MRNCACRGEDAGFAHLSCLAQYARSSNRDHMRKNSNNGRGGEEIVMNKITEPWKFCPNCKKATAATSVWTWPVCFGKTFKTSGKTTRIT